MIPRIEIARLLRFYCRFFPICCVLKNSVSSHMYCCSQTMVFSHLLSQVQLRHSCRYLPNTKVFFTAQRVCLGSAVGTRDTSLLIAWMFSVCLCTWILWCSLWNFRERAHRSLDTSPETWWFQHQNNLLHIVTTFRRPARRPKETSWNFWAERLWHRVGVRRMASSW